MVAPNIRYRDGQGRTALEFARYLALDGHSVVCYSNTCPEELTSMELVSHRRIAKPGPDLIGIPTFPIQATRAIDRGNHDVVCVMGACAFPAAPVAYYAPFSQSGWRDSWDAFGKPDLLRRIASSLGARNERKAVGNAQSVMCVSQMILDQLGPLIPASAYVEVVPGGIDIEEFPVPDPQKKAASRSALRLGESQFAIAIIGEYSTGRKGLDFLARAIAMRRDPDEVILVKGAGPEEKTRARMRELGVEGNVRFLSEGHPLDVLAACDAVAIPSTYEPFSIVAIESAAAARPVIISKRAGAAHTLGEAALHVDPIDIASIRSAIDYLREDPAKAEAMARAGRAIAEKLTWENVSRQAIGVITRTANPH